MWIDGKYVVPSQVVAVVPLGQKKRKGAVTSRGCTIWFTSGGVLDTKLPTTQVVAMLGIHPTKE